MKVLIADDNITDLNGICDFIPWETLDCTVVASAQNGAEGLEAALKTKPDLIIADISMPFMDGITMCKKIRESLPDVYIIFLSCLEEFSYVKQAINMGKCDYITKPIDINQVVESILKMKNTRDDKIQKELTIFQLEKEMAKNRPDLIKNFLRDIILKISSNKTLIKRRAKEFDIDTSEKFTQILFVSNDTSQAYPISNQLLSNLIQNLLIENFGGWIVDIKIGTFVTILTGEIDSNRLLDLLRSLQNDFLEMQDVELTICIGNSDVPFEQLHIEYERLTDILNNNLFYMPNSIVYADDFNNKDSYLPYNVDFSELSKDISLTLASSEERIDEYFLKKYLIKDNPTLSKTSASYIMFNLNIMLSKMNISSEIFQLKTSLENIMSFTSYSQIKNYLADILTKCHTALETGTTTSSEYIVKKIKDIIKTEYASIETIEDITDKLYLNPLYTNRIFKQHTGKTIYEWLLNLRMEKAEELLKTSPLKAGDVGKAVGYKTARYFSTVFKNHTGLTPIQYRTKYFETDFPPKEE